MKADPENLRRYKIAHDVAPRLRIAQKWFFPSCIIALILVLALAISSIPEVWLLSVLAIIVMCVSGVFYWEYLTPIQSTAIRCTSCSVFSAAYPFEEWVCGFCKYTHTKPFRTRTFYEKCKNCNSDQGAITCFYCQQPIILNEATFESWPSKVAWYPGRPFLPEEEKKKTERYPKPLDEDLH